MTDQSPSPYSGLIADDFMPMYERFVALAAEAKEAGWALSLTTDSARITLTVKPPVRAALSGRAGT